MSGHSKWATTKHQKAVTDAKRSNLFTKLANVVSVAARSGSDPTMNFQLRLAIDRARAANMPKDKIERAIKRGTGELGGAQVEEILYEAYGPHGTAILIETLTDNKNRASGEIRAVLHKLGGKLAGAGAVSYLFERKGEIRVSFPRAGDNQTEVEKIEEVIIESGAEDYERIDDGYLVYTAADSLASVRDALQAKGLRLEGAQLIWQPTTVVTLAEEESQKILNLLETIDDLDDVANVSSNLG